MKFFEDIKTLDELRKEYRRLAMLHHPDKGGDTRLMQIINEQYEKLSKKLINGNTDFSQGRKDYEHQVSEEIIQRLDKIIFLQGIDIELIGSWIWVTGNTFAVRETLKTEGFKFSHPKAAWYWHKGEYFKNQVRSCQWIKCATHGVPNPLNPKIRSSIILFSKKKGSLPFFVRNLNFINRTPQI